MLNNVSLVRKSPKSEPGSNLDRYRRKPRRIWRFLGLLLVGVILWYGITFIVALNRVTIPNASSNADLLKDAFNKESAQPINILLIGIGGQSHPGGTLADSIMVASIDPKTNNISLLSVPRDLYVTIPGGGKQKINAAHSIGETQTKTGGGPALMKKVVSETLGIPIHYFIRIDFDGFKKIVDTLGGVTVDVKIPINDTLFPDAQLKGFEPFSIKAGKQKLDGKTALKYVRSRETTSDFDRARRQQEVILAIKDKALSAQVLANPKKVNDLISTAGKHLLTDFSTGEIETLIKLARELENPTINRQVLGIDENGLLTGGRSPSGASIVIPKAGIDDFSQIRLFVRSYLSAPGVKSEKPTIRLDRAGATKDTVSKVSKQLEVTGFTVTLSESDLPSTKTGLTATDKGKKPRSTGYLREAYNLTPGDKNNTEVDYVLILGSDFFTVTKTSSSASGGEKQSAHPLTTLTQDEEAAAAF